MPEQQINAQNEIMRQPQSVDVELISTAKLREKLPNILRADVPITYSCSGIKYEKGKSVGVKDRSAIQEPSVIFESGASPCSIVIAYDDASCKIIHISQYEKFLDEHPLRAEETEKVLEIDRAELQELKEFISQLGPNFRVLVTATNVSQDIQEAVFSDIAAELKIDTARMTEILLQSEAIPNQPDSKAGITKDQIHSAVYIPKIFSQDSRGKIFIIGDTEEELKNEKDVQWLFTVFKGQDLLNLTG